MERRQIFLEIFPCYVSLSKRKEKKEKRRKKMASVVVVKKHISSFQMFAKALLITEQWSVKSRVFMYNRHISVPFMLTRVFLSLT